MVTAVFEIIHHVRFFVRHSKNLLGCIIFLAGAWTGVAFFLRFILTHPGAKTHENWVIFGFIVAFVLILTAYFIAIRADELWDCMILLGLATLALPFAIVWDILSVSFLITQYCLLSASSLLLHAFLVSYFQLHPVFQAAKRFARTVQTISVSLATTFVVIRKQRYRSELSPVRDLCRKCEAIVDGSALLVGARSGLARTSEAHQHHTFAELIRSSDRCHLCSLLARSCKSSVPQHQPLSIRIWERRSLDGTVMLRMVLKSQKYPLTAYPLVIEERLRVDEMQAGRGSRTTSSNGVMKWARTTIRTCAEDHETCRGYFVPQEQTRFRPTRLLDVLSENDTEIRLVETKDIKPGVNVPYLALSHCWGKDGIDFTLTCNKLDDFKRALQISRLTKNFQDAVHITRGLGARYLWIDSLCILQDSVSDLQREIGSMGLLYANADCTISATASVDSGGGCFRDLEPFIGDCELRREGNRSLTVAYSGAHESAVARLFSDRVEVAAQAPLTSRGWAFQERILSSRVLHFCNGVVLFECNTLQSFNFHTEGKTYPTLMHVRRDGKYVVSVGPPPRPRPPKPSWPQINAWPSFSLNYMFTHSTSRVWRQGVSTRPVSRPAKGQYVNVNSFRYNQNFQPRSYSTASIHDLGDAYRSYKEHALWKPTAPKIHDMSARLGMRGAFEMMVKFEGTTKDELLEFHNSWYEIVHTYSVRNLTVPDDKLKALAGIVYFIEAASTFTYAHGLWAGDVLSFNLLWMIGGQPTVRPNRTVPSWSWASVDGLICHHLATQSTGEREIRFLTDQPVVEEDGTLLLSGCRTFVPNRSHGEHESGYNFYPDTPQPDQSGGLVCVPILQMHEAHALPGKSTSQLHGIVLKHSPRTEQSDLYQRVGYFCIKDGRKDKQLLQTAARSQSLRIC